MPRCRRKSPRVSPPMPRSHDRHARFSRRHGVPPPFPSLVARPYVNTGPCPGRQVGGVLGQGCDVDRHVGEERQVPEDLVQFLVVLDVEDAEVGVLPDASPDVHPGARLLQVLAVRLLARHQVRAHPGVEVARQVDVHPYREQHRASHVVEDEVVGDLAAAAVRGGAGVEDQLGLHGLGDVVRDVAAALEVQLGGDELVAGRGHLQVEVGGAPGVPAGGGDELRRRSRRWGSGRARAGWCGSRSGPRPSVTTVPRRFHSGRPGANWE